VPLSAAICHASPLALLAESFFATLESAPVGSAGTSPGDFRTLHDRALSHSQLQTGFRFSTKAAIPSWPSGATALHEITSAIMLYASACRASTCL